MLWARKDMSFLQTVFRIVPEKGMVNKKEFVNGYVFRRLDARAKVFIEYVPAEYAGFR